MSLASFNRTLDQELAADEALEAQAAGERDELLVERPIQP